MKACRGKRTFKTHFRDDLKIPNLRTFTLFRDGSDVSVPSPQFRRTNFGQIEQVVGQLYRPRPTDFAQRVVLKFCSCFHDRIYPLITAITVNSTVNNTNGIIVHAILIAIESSTFFKRGIPETAHRSPARKNSNEANATLSSNTSNNRSVGSFAFWPSHCTPMMKAESGLKKRELQPNSNLSLFPFCESFSMLMVRFKEAES